MEAEKSDKIKLKTRSFVSSPPGHISLLLRSNSGLVPLANLSYRIHVGRYRVLEGTTDKEGYVSHESIPPGDYRMKLKGFDKEIIVPSLSSDIERYPFRVSGYMLFEDDAPEDEESFPDFESAEEISLNEIDEEGWEDLDDE